MNAEQQFASIAAFVGAAVLAWVFVVKPFSSGERAKQTLESLRSKPLESAASVCVATALFGFLIGVGLQLPKVYGTSLGLMMAALVVSWYVTKRNRDNRRRRHRS